MINKAKLKYFEKVYTEAEVIECLCGCGEKIKAKDKYGRDKKFVNGHNGRKYKDPTQYKREWNHRNRDKRFDYKTLYSYKRKRKLLELKGNKCIKCGVKYDGTNASIFDFHHIKEREIRLNITCLSNYSWIKILKEIEKCELMCSNCHRMEHSTKF